MFLVIVFAACAPEQQATWLDGVYFRWQRANHRLAYAHFRPDDAGGVQTSLIGGLSTSKAPWDIDDTCDPDACREFRTNDDGDVRVTWSRVTTSQAVLASGRAELLSTPEGGTTTVSVDLPGRAGDEVSALLQGFVIDSDHPLDGDPACYNPEYGWHPRRIRFAIDDVVRTSTGADVTVSAAFAPGATEDPQRACIDAVYERSLVPMSIDVLVVAGDGESADEVVSSGADYEFGGNQFNPEPQEEVAPTPLTLDTEGAMVGWSAVDFAFNPDKVSERGTYLRSWGFEIGPAGAAGLATNFSRGTQLHAMAYTFTGSVRAIPVDGVIETGTVEQSIPADLDIDARPVVHTFPLE